MKTLTKMMVVFGFILLLVACGNSEVNEQNVESDGADEVIAESDSEIESLEFVAANYKSETDDQGESLNKFIETVDQLSDGNIEVEAFHNAELGNAQESVEKTINGSIDIAEVGSSGLDQFGMNATPVPELPYLFDSYENFVKVMNDEEIKSLLQTNIEKEGLVLLGYRLAPASHIVSNEPLKSIEDYKDLNLRSPEFEITETFLKAWGARPTILPLPDVYNALQNGVVEGYTATPQTVLSNHTYEISEYLNMTEHMFTPQYIVMNKEKFENMSPEAQEVILEAGKESEDYINNKSFEEYENDLDELVENGVELVEYDDLSPFKNAVVDDNEKLAEKFGDEALELYEKILDVNK